MHSTPSLTYLSINPFDTPNPHDALMDPDGLVAVGGDLCSQRLIHLYKHGFFPWYNTPDPILWWHPSERCILIPDNFHLSKSLRKSIRNTNYHIRINTVFNTVITRCAHLRANKEGTWINQDIIKAYCELNRLGYAHSIEVWSSNTLVGGFYGVAIDRVFYGESMFSEQANASKMALYFLCQHAKDYNIELIDCQIESDHLISLGATMISKMDFLMKLSQFASKKTSNTALIQLSGQEIALIMPS